MRDATLAFLATHRRERLEVVADRLVETIERDNPSYRPELVPRADLWRSCHDNVARILELLANAVRDAGMPPRSANDPVYDAARATGRLRAEQGLPLDDVLRSFRIGGRLIWQDLVERGEGTLGALELREIGTWLWEVVDDTSAQVAIAYHALEQSLVRAHEQQRAELWEGVLSGRAREPGFARDAALLLDVPADRGLLVVASPSLDRRRADERLSPHASAWVRRTEGVVGLVALRDASPDDVLAMLTRLADEEGVPVGVSTVVAGFGGVHEGFRQAALALRAQGRTPGLASLDRRLPEAMLLSSPDLAAQLVARWVDPLLRLPPAEAEALLQTLTAWVATAGSASRTAESVHCHRNTVVNRLRRVGDLTSTRLADDAPPMELDLALRAWRMGISHTE